MTQTANRKLMEGHGILWSYTNEEYSYEVYASSPYIKAPGTRTHRFLLVERIHTKSNNRCWFTISQNLKLKFDNSEEPIPFDQDHGRDFCYGNYFENNWERAYADYIKRIMKDNSKELFLIEQSHQINCL